MTDKLALIIEDDIVVVEIFDQALRGANLTTELICDGTTTQKRLKELVPHIVVLDIHLPGIPGQYLLSQIRADKRLEETIVLVATADAQMADALSETSDFVLAKPVSFSQPRDLTLRLHDYYHGSTQVLPGGKIIISGYKTDV